MIAALRARPLLLLGGLLACVAPLLYVLEWLGWFALPQLRFERPWLTPPGAAVVLFVAWRLLGFGQKLSSARRALVDALTLSAALAAAWACAGVELGQGLHKQTVVLALDRSRSIDLVPDVERRLERELELAELGLHGEDRLAVVAFGAEAAVEQAARPRSSLSGAQRVSVARDGTDLAAAIRQALTEIPPDSAGRVVLLTDGVATRGDTTQAALAAAALGVPVDSVALDQQGLDDIRVVGLRLPARAAQNESIALRLVTHSPVPADVELRVYLNGELVRKGTAHIEAGEDVLHLRETAPEPGLHRYEVELSALDGKLDRVADDNRAAAFVRVRGEARALIVEGEKSQAAPMAAALRSAGFRVDLADITGLPHDLPTLARYDLLILGDVRASEWAPAELASILSYVKDLGGGLLLMGGGRSLGPGGYAKTPIEEASPVSFDLKQDRRRGSLAEIIAVDYSGSMSASAGGKTKLELANEAAARSAELLGAGDRLGVLHVDTTASWTVPLSPVTDTARIVERIRRVGPGGGGIFVDVALSTAYAALTREGTQLKHLLLFADGSDAENSTGAPRLVSNAAARGITTSVVALGSGSDVPMLARLSELGSGRFYLVEDATRLPAVFAQETVLATRSAISDEAFVPRVGSPSAVLNGIAWETAPALGGYVISIPKARSRVLLSGPENDPLLASWSVGVGRAAAFTSDYKGRWGKAWTDWEPAARLFAQLARELSRQEDDPNVRLEADASGGDLVLSANVLDERGRRDSLRKLRARVVAPDGTARTLPLEAVTVGGYSARFATNRPGAYLVSLTDEESGRVLASAGAELPIGGELRPTGTDRAELRRVAALTRGKLRDTLAGIFSDRDTTRLGYVSISQWLLLAAAWCLLAAVAARRLQLPALRRIQPTRAVVEATVETPAASTLGSLLSARQRKRPAPLTPSPPAPASPHPPTDGPSNTAPGAPVSPAAEPPRAEPPTKTAAEIVLERRRARTNKS